MMPPKREDQNVPFFKTGADGSKVKTFVRHARNNRKQMSARLVYVKNIIKEGFQKTARAGGVYVVPREENGVEVLHVISGATLLEAIYDAHSEAPEAPQVVATVSAGYPPFFRLHPETPPDVIDHIRDRGNKYNQLGVSASNHHVKKRCLVRS